MHEESTETNNFWWHKISKSNNIFQPVLLYISNLKTRKNNLPFNSNTYLIEHEIGLILSQIYNLRKLNHLPHRNRLTPFYQQSLGIFTQYKITLKELQDGKCINFYPIPITSRQKQTNLDGN